MKFWIKVESILPRSISFALQRKLEFTGDVHESRRKVGFIAGYPLFVGIALALIYSIIINTHDTETLVLAFLVGTIMAYAVFWVVIDYLSMKRSRKIEGTLPDALELVAVSMKSGMTVEQSLVESARPEFGEIEILFKRAAKEMFSGVTFEKALHEISQKIDSLVLQRVVILTTEGMKKGAALGDLLIRISSDLRNEEALKQEINANISIYITLIIIATCLGAPLLFGAGAVVADSFDKKTIPTLSADQASRAPGLFNLFSNNFDPSQTLNHDDLFVIAIVSIAVTCFFASLMIGVIRTNKETAGLRYFPAFFVVSLIVYFGASFLLRKVVFGA